MEAAVSQQWSFCWWSPYKFSSAGYMCNYLMTLPQSIPETWEDSPATLYPYPEAPYNGDAIPASYTVVHLENRSEQSCLWLIWSGDLRVDLPLLLTISDVWCRESSGNNARSQSFPFPLFQFMYKIKHFLEHASSWSNHRTVISICHWPETCLGKTDKSYNF